jgi:hypothetical protein
VNGGEAGRVWLALADEPPDEAIAAASVEEDGNAAGFLVAWERRTKPRRRALRVDPRIIDPQELLTDDPFGRVFPARLLWVAEGVLGAALSPVGPVIERYGSANPWPGDRFAGQGT